MLYIANNIPAFRKQQFEPSDSEIIIVELHINKIKLLVLSCYRPQHRDIIDFCDDLESIIDAASQDYHSFIILGNMNARNKSFWEDDITNTEVRAIKAFFDSHNFDQLIHELTRIQGTAKSCIDLIFTNNPSLIASAGTRPKICDTSDRKQIYVTLKSTFFKPHSHKRWERFQYALLETCWHFYYQQNDFDSIIESWMNFFLQTAESYILHYLTPTRPCDKSL